MDGAESAEFCGRPKKLLYARERGIGGPPRMSNSAMNDMLHAPLRAVLFVVPLVALGCSQAAPASSKTIADIDSMPSSMPPPPRGACREGPTEPQLCGFVSTMRLRDVFGSSVPTQRGFGAADARDGDPPLRPVADGRGPWVYEGLMMVPEAGRYQVRVEGAAAATLYFDDPRHVARHERGVVAAFDPELEAGVHWFWLVADRPSGELSVFLRRDMEGAAEARVKADGRMEDQRI
jgi:hypothetical protein